MALICIMAQVSGRVQGVGFRYHTAHEGLRLGLTGYAKNLADGQVEVVACGQEQALTLFLQWLAQGPKTANVTRLVQEQRDWQHRVGFEIR